VIILAKNRIFSTDTKDLLRELQGLDRRINNLLKAAEEARRYGVKVADGIENLQPSGIKAKDVKALGFDNKVARQMISSTIRTLEKDLAKINKKQVSTMKKYTKIEKEFEPDKIITGRAPRSGAAGHDRYTAIMDTIAKSQRDERRHRDGEANFLGYDSTGFFEIYDYAVKHGMDFMDAEKIYLDPDMLDEEF